MFNEKIICTYLYAISKYGYPPKAGNSIHYIDEMKSLGFGSVELEGIREEHLLGVYALRNEISNHIKRENIRIPVFCAVLPGCCSLDEKERNRNFELFEKGCEIASVFGSEIILDNAPMPPYTFPSDIPIVRHYDEDSIGSANFPKNLRWEQFWDLLIDAYKTLCDIAGKYNLTYHIHPALGLLASTTDSFLYLAEKVNRDNLRFNLDTANQFLMKDNLSLSLIRLKDYIDYIHISDNSGLKVEHLSMGEGKINWDVFLESLDRINYKGYIGLDIGGSESNIDNLDDAYKSSAEFLEHNWLGN